MKLLNEPQAAFATCGESYFTVMRVMSLFNMHAAVVVLFIFTIMTVRPSSNMLPETSPSGTLTLTNPPLYGDESQRFTTGEDGMLGFYFFIVARNPKARRA